jgi:hypothetical protein
MPTSITSSGITFDDATTQTTSALAAGAIGATQLANGAVTLAKLGTNEQKQVCKAWVNFNGTGTVAIRKSFNVSSITDHGTGKYTVNFTNALVDNEYSVSGMCSPVDASNNGYATVGLEFGGTYSTTAVRITCLGFNVFIDPATVCVQAFSN